MWRGEVRRGRAGQAFDFGEPGVLDGATAKSLAAGRHEPQQVGQIARTKPMRRSCLRILDQSLKPRERRSSSNRPLEQPGAITLAESRIERKIEAVPLVELANLGNL